MKKPLITIQGEAPHPALTAESPTASFDISTLVETWIGKDHTAVLLKADNLRVVFRSLRDGSTLPPHKAAGDITVQVLNGQIEFTAAGQTLSLQKGQVIALKAGVPHSVTALRQAAILITLAAGQRS